MHAPMMHPTGTSQQSRQGWAASRMAWLEAIVAAVGLAMIYSPAVQAITFDCGAGDVSCLIASITQANAQSGPQHEIRLAAGVYTLTAVENDTDGPNGLPSVTSKLTIRGVGEDVTILQRATQAHEFRLLHVAATGALTLHGLTVSGGFSFGNDGGALYNHGGTVTITHSTLMHNQTGLDHGFGGALYNHGGTVTITHSTLADNEAFGANDGHGGALYTEGGRVTIINTTLTGNRATGVGPSEGGALVNRGGTVTIANSTLAQNVAGGGGNDHGFGGGLVNSGGTVTITNSTFAQNVASGGIFFGGGGLVNGGGTVTITSTTFAQNVASGENFDGGGGAILSSGTITLTNSTLAENTVRINTDVGLRPPSGGGGLYNLDGTATLQNTILARNTLDCGGEDCFGINVRGPDCLGSVTSRGHNLIGDPTDCTLTLQRADLTGDPGLASFSDTETPGAGHFPLLPTSQAIDGGTPSVCPKTDQLGQNRVRRCDIGAIEFQGKALSLW